MYANINRMNLFGPFLLALSLLQVAGSSSQLGDKYSWLEQAKDHFQRGEWERSRQAALKALEIDPHLAEGEALLGQVAAAQGRFREAEKYFLKALSLQPASDVVEGYLASTYLAQKRLEDARRAFQKVLQLNPASQTSNYNLGLIALTEGRPAEALPYFEKVHGADPSHVPALMGILESQLLLGHQPEARQSTQDLEALLKPSDPRLFQVASLLALHQGYDTAIPLMEQVRQFFPQSYEVNYNLALAYFHYENYEQAARSLQSLLDRQPRAEAYNLFAMVEERRAHYVEAVRAFQKASQLAPGNEDYRFDYGYELLRHQTGDAAVAIFATGVRDFPKSVKMWLGLGGAYYVAGEFKQAAEAVLKATTIDHDNKLAYFMLAKIYERAPLSQFVVREKFRAYLERNPDDPWSYYHYGTMLYLSAQSSSQPDFNPAKSYLSKAIRLNPNFAEAHLQLGIIVQREGQFEKSTELLQRAIQINPKVAAAHYRLALAYQRLGQAERAKAEFETFKRLDAQSQAKAERQEVVQFVFEQRH